MKPYGIKVPVWPFSEGSRSKKTARQTGKKDVVSGIEQAISAYDYTGYFEHKK